MSEVKMETPDPNQPKSPKTTPYPASFIDKLLRIIERLPGPYWLSLLILLTLQVLVTHILAWIDGWLPPFEFSPLVLLFPVWLWGTLGIMIYLNSIALEALSSFSQLLDKDQVELEGLKYEFTTMPARGVILSSMFWAVVYISLTYLAYETVYVAYGLGTFLSVVVFLSGLLSFSTGSVIYYHSLRQLGLVNRTVKMVKTFNLFQLDPVYAFSRLTARTGISWMILLSLTLLFYPSQGLNVAAFAILVVQVGLALAAFVLPLRFVNNRLVAEKRRLLAELNRRLESTLERLHHHIDANELAEVDPLNSALEGLKAEREVLMAIPTWPWRTGTLTSFLSVIVLPIILYLIQLIIDRWLGG